MAKLKALVAKLEEVPEGFRELYTKTDDGFVLDVEDKDYSTKLKEFRDNNINLRKDQEKAAKMMEKYKDIDPDKYAEYAEKAKQLEKVEQENLAKAGNFEELFAKRTEAMRKDYETRLKTLEEKATTNEAGAKKYRESLRTLKVQGAVRDAVSKVGAPRPGAMDDILLHADRTFQLDDNDDIVAPGAFDSDAKPLTLDGWAKRLVTERAYLFEPTQGGGSQGGNRGTGAVKGVKVLNNPTASEFGANLEDIASGKIQVNIPSGT